MAEKQIEPNGTGVIRVQGEVYNKIAEIAENEERTMGGQVAYMVKNLCSHPLESRIPINAVVAVVNPPTKKSIAQVGKGQPIRGFFCAKCEKYVLPGVSDEMNDVFNLPLDGVIA